jgi:hypothetical protein
MLGEFGTINNMNYFQEHLILRVDFYRMYEQKIISRFIKMELKNCSNRNANTRCKQLRADLPLSLVNSKQDRKT